MELREAELYHQIHPAKLASDISASILSSVLFWRRRLVAGLIATFVPAVIGSALVIRFADLDRIRDSRRGAYLRRWMTPSAQAVRAGGAVGMAVGAWRRRPGLIAVSLAAILVAWFRGLGRPLG